VETRSPTGLSINVAPEHSTGTVQRQRQGKGGRGDSLDYYWLLTADFSWGEPDDMHPAARIAPGIKCGGVASPENSTTEVFSPGVVILMIIRERQQQGTILIMPSRAERIVSFLKKSGIRAGVACPIAFHCSF